MRFLQRLDYVLFGDGSTSKRSAIVTTEANYNSQIHSNLFGGGTGSAVVNEKTSLSLSAVWACVKIPAESLASMPRGVFYKNEKGDSIIAKDSPAKLVLKRPNPLMTSYVWTLVMGYCYGLRGNAYSQVIRGIYNEPLEMWPIHPDRVEIKVENGEIVYYVDRKDRILAVDMIHWKNFSNDGISGMSPIIAQKQTLGLALSTKESQNKYYENNSPIDTVLTTDRKLDIDTVANTRASWKAQAQNADGGRMRVVDGGFKLEQLKVTPEEMQYLEASKASIPDIARIFTMPLHKIADLGAATNNNIEHQGIDYVTDTMMPRAKGLEEELELKLLAQWERDADYYIKFNLNGLMRGDFAGRVEGYAKLRAMGLPLNEILKMEELNSVEGGDVSLAPLNMIQADKLTEYHFNVIPKGNAPSQKAQRSKKLKKKELNGHATIEDFIK